MNINIGKYFTVIFFIILLASCRNKETKPLSDTLSENGSQQQETASKDHEEPEPTIASLNDDQIKAVGIQLGVVEQKELTATLKVNGALRVPNNNKANATSLYGGVIKSINVQLGDHVNKGQVVATISNPQFITLQEEYLNTASKITYAEQEVTRQKELNGGNAGALKNLQSANADLNALRTRRASLEQQIRLMGIDPEKISNNNLFSSLIVASPISGTISNVIAKIGSYVDVSAPVAEIVDNDQIHLDLNVFEKDLPMLKVGQVIHFRITNNAGEDYNAKVYSIGASFENDSKSIPVHATIQGNKAGLIDGMNITAIVSLTDVTKPAVPNEAIVSSMGKDYIFIVTDKKPHEEVEEKKDKEPSKNSKEETNTTNFEKIEVLKGISNLGYTAITFVNVIGPKTQIVTKGSFFINAKLTNKGEE
jgi:cobalt-zinc-cadmium efflux system membrane fusion protein